MPLAQDIKDTSEFIDAQNIVTFFITRMQMNVLRSGFDAFFGRPDDLLSCCCLIGIFILGEKGAVEFDS